MKTRISQSHIKNLSKLQQKLQQLSKIQSQMYQRIKNKQGHTLSKLDNREQKNRRCMKERPINIKEQTFEQIVKHPVNGDERGNGCWMYLANFIQERHNLDEVERRMLQREKIRDDMQRIRRSQRQKQQNRVRREQQQRRQRQGLGQQNGRHQGKGKKGFKGNKSNNVNNNNNKNNKIAYNLQRQLHRREVQQNRRRMQRMQQYRKQQYLRSHNFYY